MNSDGADAPADDRVRVLLPIQGVPVLDYLAGALDLKAGDIVRVPLGPREVHGVVWDKDRLASPDVPAEKLKAVLERVDLPGLTRATRRFILWVARYYLAAPNSTLRMTLNVPAALRDAPLKKRLRLAGPPPDRMTAARTAVLDTIEPDELVTAKELSTRAGVSDAVVRGLVAAGTFEEVLTPADQPFRPPDHERRGPALSADQQAAAAALVEAVAADDAQTLSLEGVTGAGKTEVYFEAVARALETEGAQVLVLLPEIALTAQWLKRFRSRFGAAPVMWHSDLTQSERRRAWGAVIKGDARVVVGARSALFLPFHKLALIIVDEEHDPSYKQEDGLCYNARDMAVVRGQLHGVPVVLASATPSLETRVNVERGRYSHLTLTRRYGGAELPDIKAVDMRREAPPAGEWLSPPLKDAIQETLARGRQSLLFLNRRGYAPLTLCRTCGERLECPQCTAWLVEHRYQRRLMCHHCGFAMPTPKACPTCESEDSLVACGPGVERLAEEVAVHFPAARRVEVTSDTIYSPKRAAELVRAIEEGAVDVIIGTQLITKGYDFPNLTLVGVVDADIGLGGGDLRAAERSFQQLTQVAGRAGRAQHAGRVIVQTHMPEHPVMAALISGDAETFFAREAEARRQRAMPPFGRLAAVIVSGKVESEVVATARALGRAAPHPPGVAILGPAPAPLAVLRGRHRHRLLMKADKDVAVQPILRGWLRRVKRPNSVRIALDIDPYSFL